MVTVAVAGASSGLGYQILKAILATKKHTLVVLSRAPSAALANLGAEVKVVDYADHASLVAALTGVHTVICSVGSFKVTVMRDTQLALLTAAKEAGVKRFAPSEFAFKSADFTDLYQPKITVWEACKASGLECTRFCCGLFLNILGSGTPKGEDEALGGLRPWSFVLNMKAGTADLPGDGAAQMSLTSTWDIGQFVAASLDLEAWPEELTFEGDRKSFRELIALIEKVQARKFLVKENSINNMEQMIEENPETAFYNQCRIHIAEGGAVTGKSLNELCPDVKPTTAEEFIERWWSGTDLGEPQWQEDQVFG